MNICKEVKVSVYCRNQWMSKMCVRKYELASSRRLWAYLKKGTPTLVIVACCAPVNNDNKKIKEVFCQVSVLQNEQTISWVKYSYFFHKESVWSRQKSGQRSYQFRYPFRYNSNVISMAPEAIGMKPTSIWTFYSWIIPSMTS